MDGVPGISFRGIQPAKPHLPVQSCSKAVHCYPLAFWNAGGDRALRRDHIDPASKNDPIRADRDMVVQLSGLD